MSVTTAASTYDLVSLADVKADWAITGTDATRDAFLSRAISRCSTAAGQYCNRVFPSEMVTETFFAERDIQPRMNYGGVDPLQLTRWPIVAITSVVEGIGTAAITLDPARSRTSIGASVERREQVYSRAVSTSRPDATPAKQGRRCGGQGGARPKKSGGGTRSAAADGRG